jgi:integrase
MFRALVARHVLPFNPALDVRGPKIKDPRSRTPVFEPQEAADFFAAFHGYTLQDQRNLALTRVFFHHCCRVSALIGLRVGDYYAKGGRVWLKFSEKGGKVHDVPVHPKAQAAIESWLAGSGLQGHPQAPLFSSFERDRETLTFRPMNRRSVYRLVGRLARRAGIQKRIGCHSFRATGITFFRMNGGSLEDASRLANHASLNTTKIYDRTFDEVLVKGVERVDVPEIKVGR